jgi:hypothetical protein
MIIVLISLILIICNKNRYHSILFLVKRVSPVNKGYTKFYNQTNSMALSPRTNYTDWSTATCRRNLVPTFVDRGVSRVQGGGSPTVVNLSCLDRYKVLYMKYLQTYISCVATLTEYGKYKADTKQSLATQHCQKDGRGFETRWSNCILSTSLILPT